MFAQAHPRVARALAALALVAGGGCAAHVTRVDSEPSGARLSVNGRFVGVTPTAFEEGGHYSASLFVFKYEKDGYETRVDEHRKTEFCLRHLVDLRPYYIGVLRPKRKVAP